ncbi:MAG: nicotinate-nucleotide--dimethylbenzimidazole phosphoribosyltransferase [Fusobacteria bacterium]|nr:MAG: nicotinate-nucleotide--dimethylbenzimidazole phosphoribosyltransferase [Fusobacteriota bacterium]
MSLYKETLKKIKTLNKDIMKEAKQILDSRMKPLGSLGKLEEIAIQISGITGTLDYKIKKKLHIVASADNGILEEGVSSCPLEYTKLVSEAMLSKIAAIGILCDTLDIDLKLIDIGIKDEITREYENLYRKKIKNGTNNFVYEPAMTYEECIKAIEVGISVVEENLDYDIFSNGEMGVGNTTTSSAILYAMTGEKLDLVVGRGGGLSDSGLEKKKKIIEEAVKKYDLFDSDPIEILRCVGGLDIACMVGMYLGCAANSKPILIDGFISSIAALVAQKINHNTVGYMIATHKSEELGMVIVSKLLEKPSFLDMNMRLGEGTGAVLAYPIIISALEIMKRMKTPEEVYKILG